MVVVADTTPLHYLILIEHIHVLPALFADVWIPTAVLSELTQPQTPAAVSDWAAVPPPGCAFEPP